MCTTNMFVISNSPFFNFKPSFIRSSLNENGIGISMRSSGFGVIRHFKCTGICYVGDEVFYHNNRSVAQERKGVQAVKFGYV